MDKNFIIGLVYLNDPNWVGGTYYIENIVSALRLLPREDQPELKIYCYSKEEFDFLRLKTGYEFMTPVYLIYSLLWIRLVNAISIRIFKKYLLLPRLKQESNILFPASERVFFRNFQNKVWWIPDFQEFHFPAFFSSKERLVRKEAHLTLIKKNYPIVFSSINAQNDFRLNYPEAKNPTFVIPFAVTIPDLSGINFDTLRAKYKVDGDYFISSNQFWAHKNHLVVIKAVQELKKRNVKVKLFFTGKPYDNRNPSYYQNLLDYVKANDLYEEINFLGFIDRTEQLLLMKHSKAIIQPSLFEGWSTVIEDAKALNHPILVSDIPVHREQLGENFSGYFSPSKPKQLATLMQAKTQALFVQYTDKSYRSNIEDFAKNILTTFKEIAAV